MTSIFGRNFKTIRQAAGMTQGQAAEKIDVSTVTVNNWETGKVAYPKQQEVIKAIEDSFGVEYADLFSDSAGYYAKFHGTTEATPVNAIPMIPSSEYVSLPLYGRVHAGDAQEPDILDGNIPVPAEIAKRHPKSYFLEVEGDCMDRIYTEESLILVDPEKQPTNGSIAVVSIDGADYIMRRYFKGANNLILSPDSHNPEWQDIIISDAEEHTVSTIGVVVWFQSKKELQ